MLRRSPAARRGFTAVPAVAAVMACARPAPPPGGDADQAPPRVVATRPEPLEIVPGFEGPVVIRFDERLSERGLEDAVLVSPYTGPTRVRRDGSALEISVAGGWRDGTIYHVLVRPTIRDLFGNVRQAPVELVFSTGPEIPATVLAGVVTDRLTGRPAEGARVEAIGAADSVTYVGVAERDGVFALRNIPGGEYLLRAYLDQNRNRELNAFEPRDQRTAEVLPGDTTLLALALLPRDTTAAILERVRAIDSLHVRLQFSDYLDPALPTAPIRAQLWRLPDSTRVAVEELLHAHEYEARVAEQRRLAAQAARAAADTLGGDTAAAAAERADTAAAAGAREQPTEPLPSRELILLSAVPLQPQTEYRVTISDVTNIAGLPGGGGTATFELPAAAPPAAPQPDTARAPATPPRDTTGAPRR